MAEESKHPDRFKEIENKLASLIEVHRQTKKRLLEAMSENAELKKKIELGKAELDDFKNQQKISKIANVISEKTSSNNAELKLKINVYLKEIDKCIAHLERIS